MKLRLDHALAAFRRLLGHAHVVTEEPARRAAARATFPTAQSVRAIVRPRTTSELVGCMAVANEHRLPIHPVSGGRNWGYGSRVPMEDGSVIVDLARMNRIRAHDENLAYVVVEPGVTFEALEAFLQAAGSRLTPLSVGSSARASIVGNVLERGFGQGGYSDRFANVCGLEIVLPSGAVVRTGFSRFPKARAGNVGRWGVGPSLDGLFSQSNLGIVTRMAVWLPPAPPLQDTLQFGVERERDLPGMLDALQSLRLRGVLRGSCAVSSRERVVAAVQQYPWDEARGVTPLPPRVLARVRRLGIRRWMGWATMGYQSLAVRRAERALVVETLGKYVDDLRFRSTSTLSVKREPNLPYWRKRSPRPADSDPDRDGCGVLTYSPVVPFVGRELADVAAVVSRTLLDHGFDPIVQLQCTSERSVIVNGMILFDRDVADEEARAVACYDRLARKLGAAHYFPYRRAILGMETAGDDGHAQLLAALKRAVDPHDLLASGRYIPPRARRPAQPSSSSALSPRRPRARAFL